VDTVIVDGKIIMERGKVLAFDETKAMEAAQKVSDDLLQEAKKK
jgi:predicted metalloprotease